MQRFVSWNLSDFGIFGNSMCLRISKTLRPKILSASGFQPNSKLESVENPGLQIPDAHVASDQRCCGGRMWLRGIEFPFSKG